MKSKEEIMILWILLGLIVVPLVILYPLILVFGIFMYAAINLYKHYSNGWYN
jgi:hypothetical protein